MQIILQHIHFESIWFIIVLSMVHCCVLCSNYGRISLSLDDPLIETTSPTHPLSLSLSLSNSHSLSRSRSSIAPSPFPLSFSWSRTLLFISSANLALSHSLTIFYGKCDSTKIINSWAWEGNNNNDNNNNKESHTQHHTSVASICLPTILTR